MDNLCCDMTAAGAKKSVASRSDIGSKPVSDPFLPCRAQVPIRNDWTGRHDADSAANKVLSDYTGNSESNLQLCVGLDMSSKSPGICSTAQSSDWS